MKHKHTAAPKRRKRKTRDVYEVRGDYGYGHGYEMVTAEVDPKAARQRLREYRRNEPGVPFRIVRVREPIETGSDS